MLLEAVDHSIWYTWPEGKIHLEPGKPIQVPDDRGAKVLAKCGGKVRKVSPDWLGAWAELTQVITGIEKSDPRFMPIVAALDQCDLDFEKDNWPGFLKAAQQVKDIIKNQL